MNRWWAWALLGCALVALPAAAAKPARYAGADDLTQRIDRALEEAWAKGNVVAAKPADDGEWLRRVYLDLAGRIPTVTEARAFLADRRPERRQRIVEELLSSQRFATHFATVWRNLLIPEANSNFQVRFQVGNFERWVRDWLTSGRGYDAMVKELLTVPVDGRGAGFVIGGSATSSQAFYAAKEYKSEELAAAASRLFLGVNLGCAQCHNHPFAEWKKEQFWSFAAFFSGIRTQRQGDFMTAQAEKPDAHEIAIPNTDKVVKAKYLDGKQPEIKAGMKSREVMVNWMVAKDNPYFARAAVNRLWAHLFGTGLMEPLDEMAGGEAQPSHPALLDELARSFAEQNYDVRWLIRAMTLTRAYQLTSRRSHASQDDAKQFAKAALRGLTPEQLFDSVATATGYQEEARGNPYFGGASARGEFLTKFANDAERPTERQTSILQALTLMNGRVLTSATNLKGSETLGAIADAPFMTPPAKVEALYLAALTRKPTAKELARATAHLDKGDAGEALADVFWVLLNSSEFVLNH